MQSVISAIVSSRFGKILSFTIDTRRYLSGNLTHRLLKIAKLSLLLFATLLVSSAYAPQFLHGANGTSFSKFPVGHQEFLSSISADAVFGTSTSFTSGSTAPTTIVGPNIRVNAPQQPSPNGLLGRSETSVAVGANGLNSVAGWNEANGFLKVPFTVPSAIPGTPGLSGFAFSTDGGNTWTDTGPPPLFPATTPFFSGNVVTRGDPWMAVAPVGGTETFYYANLAVFANRDSNNNIVDAGVSVHRGTFTGTSFTFSDLHLLSAPNAPFDFYDKEAVAARQVNGQTIVAVSVTNFIGISTPGTNPAACQFGGGFGQIEVWRSADGGNTFQGPVIVQPDQTNIAADRNCGTGTLNQGSMPVIGPDGSVVVAWTNGPKFAQGSVVDSPTESIMAAGSTDGGKTFSSPVLVQKIIPGRQNPPVGFNRARYNDFPRLAVSSSGVFFLALQNAVVAGNQGIG
ncbi:hypothetical protein E6H35_04055, partial [Candidatus Bathyarchaeota archaeon]